MQLHLNRTLNKLCSGGKSQDYSLSELYAESTEKMAVSNTSAKLRIESESFDVVPLQSIRPEPTKGGTLVAAWDRQMCEGKGEAGGREVGGQRVFGLSFVGIKLSLYVSGHSVCVGCFLKDFIC